MPCLALTLSEIINRDCAKDLVTLLSPHINADLLPNIRICIHEALFNAAIHGNLNIDNVHDSNLKNIIQEKLNDPVLAAKPVFVIYKIQPTLITITIKDYGEPISLPRRKVGAEITQHRGLSLIKKLTDNVHFNGLTKEITMQFSII